MLIDRALDEVELANLWLQANGNGESFRGALELLLCLVNEACERARPKVVRARLRRLRGFDEGLVIILLLV